MKRFSLRETFLLFAVFALLLGWWAERSNREPPAARFQLHTPDDKNDVLLLDTATGRVWHRTHPEFFREKAE